MRAAIQLGTVHYVIKPFIREILLASSSDVSAGDTAEKVGISRSNAQRYLAELARQGKIELRLHHGATGRPQHGYRIATATK